MAEIKNLNDIDCLKDFSIENSHDISFDLFETFSNSEEEIKEFGDMFSDFYYITCPAFKEAIDQRKDIPEIHKILEKYAHTADGRPLEVLIGKYSEEHITRTQKRIEDRRKDLEGLGIIVPDPKHYMFIIGFYGDTIGRTNEVTIGMIKKMFPDKINTINIKS